MTLDIEWLEDRVFLTKIDSTDAKLIEKVTDIHTFKAGDEILEQGKPGGALYFVRSGKVTIHCNGEQLTSGGEANLFGELSFLTDDPVSATVRAETDCEIYVLNRNGYSKIMGESPPLVFALFTYILKNTNSIVNRINADYTVMQNYISGGRA